MDNENKRIVYLFGTGASQAEMQLCGTNINLLMSDVRDGIIKSIGEDKTIKDDHPFLINTLSDKTDIEHLITLYESSGIELHRKYTNILKKHFRDEITSRLKKLPIDYSPRLYSALIDLHEIGGLKEKICGILTLNYEDLIDRSINTVKGKINYAIKINNKHTFLKQDEDDSLFPILKLHGSFNWQNEFPVTLIDDNKIIDQKDVLWIPPGVEKKCERYPFNILWGKAREILDCDILRVIGCSLNRNDWQLISLLYTTQQLTNSNSYEIELIDFYAQCKEIEGRYEYLRFKKISEIKEVRNSIMKTLSIKEPKKEEEVSKAIETYLNAATTNIFDIWLRAKGEDLVARDIPIKTEKMIYEKFLRGEKNNE